MESSVRRRVFPLEFDELAAQSVDGSDVPSVRSDHTLAIPDLLDEHHRWISFLSLSRTNGACGVEVPADAAEPSLAREVFSGGVFHQDRRYGCGRISVR